MYVDRTGAPGRGSYETGLLVPPPLLFLLLSLSHSLYISGSGVHVIGWFWFHMYYILREVTIFGASRVFTSNRVE